MDCHDSRKNIYKLLDRELSGDLQQGFRTHLAGCAVCRAEYKSIEAFQGLLKTAAPRLEPSAGFEARFWNKISSFSAGGRTRPFGEGEQKEPWFVRLLREIDSLVPHPTMPQMAMVVLMAVIIGGTGGVVSTMNSTGSFEAERDSVQYLSGFREFKGVPSSSVAASFLKVVDDRGSS